MPARAGYPVTVRELFTLPSFAGAELLAGRGGLDQRVTGVNVMEVPDILPWVKPRELLLTTGFPLCHPGADWLAAPGTPAVGRDAAAGEAAALEAAVAGGPSAGEQSAPPAGRRVPAAASDPDGAPAAGQAGAGRRGGQDDAARLAGLVAGLAERGVAALGVKAGRYLDELPPAMLREADRRNFPLLLLPPAAGFDEVLSEVYTRLVDRQAAALEVADRMHRALTAIVLEGGDLPQIAQEFAALFETAVLVCTPDGRVQTVAGQPADTAALMALPLFDPTGRFRTERLRDGLQPAPDGMSGQLAVAPVVAGGTGHGLIAAYSRRGGLEAATLQALERAATVAALAITKQLAVAAVESKFRGDFLRDALSGNAGTPGQVIAHCAQLGWDVDRPLAVLVAQLDEPVAPPAPPRVAVRTPLDRLTAAWQQVVRAADPAAPVVGFSHEVVALIPATSGDVTALVAGLVSLVTGDRGGGRRSFSAGVSRVIESVAGLPQAYDEARKALLVGRRTRGPGTVAHFGALGVHRLLSLVSDAGELRSFAAEVLGPLAGDRAEAADLRRTLQALLDANCNVAGAARALHFHYNTLRYRIGKLEAMIGPFTTDPHLRLDAALALRVLEMKGL
jgi:purine catabolism regulator